VGPKAGKARQQVLQLGQFHLGFGLRGLGTIGKNIQYQVVTV
jgi:hypothetical protein